MTAPAEACRGQVINIACNHQTSLNRILDKLRELMGCDITPEYGPMRAGDVMDSLADVSLAKETIGYEPLVYFEEGLTKAIDWYKENLG